MGEDLDAQLLIELTALEEIRLQCEWAALHFNSISALLPKVRGSRNRFRRFLRDRSALFAEVQAFLTCAKAADSLLTGRSSARRRAAHHIDGKTRSKLRKGLALPPKFEIGGTAQRDSLIHIEESLVPWSGPGQLRGDFAILSFAGLPPAAAAQTLRALDPGTMEFAVLGRRCDLRKIAGSLALLQTASRAAIKRLLDAENARREAGATGG